MQNIKKILTITLSLITCLFLLTACGKEKTPELTTSKITEDLETVLTEASYTFDTIDDFTYEQTTEVSEEDLAKLHEFFDTRVDYQKVTCNFQMTSIKMDIIANYSMIYADVNGEWRVMFSYPTDESVWEYTAKETTSSKKIMADLKTVDFEGFETGYVGSADKTTIKITDRDTKLKINKDDIFVEVVVKTDFATYTIDVEMIYYFSNGEWTLSDADVQDSKYWKVEYNSNRIPETPNKDSVLEQVTKSTNFLTYVANLDYMESYQINEIKQLAGTSNITFQFEFITNYKNIGTVKYLIQIPYDWSEGEWIIGDTSVQVSDINIESWKGTWEAPNGDYIEFDSVERNERSIYESCYIASGTYYKKTAENMYSEYSIKVELNVPLRDNNWEGNVTLWEAKDMTSIEYSVKALSVDVQNHVLKTSDLTFEKTKDYVPPEKDIEGNDISSTENSQSSEISSGEVTSEKESSEVPSETSEKETSTSEKTGITG